MRYDDTMQSSGVVYGLRVLQRCFSLSHMIKLTMCDMIKLIMG